MTLACSLMVLPFPFAANNVSLVACRSVVSACLSSMLQSHTSITIMDRTWLSEAWLNYTVLVARFVQVAGIAVQVVLDQPNARR